MLEEAVGAGAGRATALEPARAPRALVALSGGADSLALTVACAVLIPDPAGGPLNPLRRPDRRRRPLPSEGAAVVVSAGVLRAVPQESSTR